MRIFAGVPWGSASNDTGVVVVATVIFSVFAGYFFRNFRGKARVIIYPLLKKYHAVPYKKVPWYFGAVLFTMVLPCTTVLVPWYHSKKYRTKIPWYFIPP